MYADPAEVKVAATDIDKNVYVVEEKGAINGVSWEEEDGIKAFTNPMQGVENDVSQAWEFRLTAHRAYFFFASRFWYFGIFLMRQLLFNKKRCSIYSIH